MTTVYTDAVVNEMVSAYNTVVNSDYETRSAMVAELAEKFGVSKQSVRSKLASVGVYKAKETAEKAPGQGVSKEEYVAALGAVLGTPVPSFVKATKADLVTLWEYLRNASLDGLADQK